MAAFAAAAAFAQVEAEAKRLAQTKLVDLFAADPKRAENFTLNAPHLVADFSKQKIDAGAMAALASRISRVRS